MTDWSKQCGEDKDGFCTVRRKGEKQRQIIDAIKHFFILFFFFVMRQCQLISTTA